MDWGSIGLIGTGVGLGLRHGIDWDHIAAITDITGTMPTEVEERRQTALVPAGAISANASGTLQMASASLSSGRLSSGGGLSLAASPTWSVAGRTWAPSQESRARFFLATLYALGHALMVVVLGILAIWASQLLPSWIDPVMQRIVGVTLLLLGVWIVAQLWRNGRDFRLRSRWMLVFTLVGRGWAWTKSRVTGQAHHHQHREVGQYGKRTAFGIGMIHGVGAETGSQALLLAGAAGATTKLTGSLLLAAFVVGLLCSNSLIAALSTFGFVSSQTRKNIYFVIGIIAAVFSLAVGLFFVTGQGGALPDLQHLLRAD